MATQQREEARGGRVRWRGIRCKNSGSGRKHAKCAPYDEVNTHTHTFALTTTHAYTPTHTRTPSHTVTLSHIVTHTHKHFYTLAHTTKLTQERTHKKWEKKSAGFEMGTRQVGNAHTHTHGQLESALFTGTRKHTLKYR